MACNEPRSLYPTAAILGILIIVLSGSLVGVASWGLSENADSPTALPEGFFLGVTASGNVSETKLLIDKVNGYTNMIVFSNLEVTENLTRLEEVADYVFSYTRFTRHLMQRISLTTQSYGCQRLKADTATSS
jgi:hypothetical protein